MDLQTIKETNFKWAIAELECEVSLPARRIAVGLMQLAAVVVGGLGGAFLAIVLAVLCLMTAAAPLNVIGGALGFIAALFASFAGVDRYLTQDGGSPKRNVLALLGPAAREFTLGQWERRKRLIADSDAYDRALRAMKGLPGRGAEDGVAEGVAANFSERRKALEERFSAYERDFRRAAAADIERVERAMQRKSKPETPKRRLKAFHQKLLQLRGSEEALDKLTGSVEAGMTVDLSPYVAVQRLRGDLEEERGRLLEEGLKPRALPAPRVQTKPNAA
jgi:hypothetical protein